MKTVLKIKKQLVAVVSLAILITCHPMTVLAQSQALSEDIVILYTNDVHTFIDGTLSYDVIAAIKDDLQTKYKNVILADAGDHIQGTAYGAMDNGETIINMMNAADYDIATLGNHEFDYGIQGCMNAISQAEFSYLSCNFYHQNAGIREDNVLDSYKLFDCGDRKIAFIGITTPETFTKTAPIYFQDSNGNYIYGISGGDDGSELKQDIQKAVDSAKAEGATSIIALGHLGVDLSSSPWMSSEAIAGVSGLDAFIDGHSHTVMKEKYVLDKDGKKVLLTQTGEYFNRIGMMVINSETGNITTDFIEYDAENNILSSKLYDGSALLSDASVKDIKDAWMSEIDLKLGQKIGTAKVIFDNCDESNNRLVRKAETNSGDFSADALYYLFDNMGLDVDIAVMNGGGIRNTSITGDLTYKTCKNIHPFGNIACLITVTGQQILDMLEWGSRSVGIQENGSFLQVSGIAYKVDISIPDTTKSDELDTWLGGPTKYRVFDVMVYNKNTDTWDALDLNEKYNLAGYNYTLRNLGDGFTMFSGATVVLDYVMEDYMVLANYVTGFENGIIAAKNSPLLAKYPTFMLDYSNISGSNRIEIVDNKYREPQDSPDTGVSFYTNSAVIVMLSSYILLVFAVVINKQKRKTRNANNFR